MHIVTPLRCVNIGVNSCLPFCRFSIQKVSVWVKFERFPTFPWFQWIKIVLFFGKRSKKWQEVPTDVWPTTANTWRILNEVKLPKTRGRKSTPMTHFSVCAAPGVCGRTGLLYNELSLVASLTTHGLTYGEKMRGGGRFHSESLPSRQMGPGVTPLNPRLHLHFLFCFCGLTTLIEPFKFWCCSSTAAQHLPSYFHTWFMGDVSGFCAKLPPFNFRSTRGV